MHLGLVRGQLGQLPPEPEGFQTQVGPDQIVAGAGGVALVEDQIDDLEDRGQPPGQFRTGRQLERDALVGQRLLGRRDALGDPGLGGEEGARDLGRRQAADQPQRQRDAGRGGQHRVAGDEHQPQDIVGLLIRLLVEVPGQFLVLAVEPLRPSNVVDRATLRDRRQPGPRIVRHPGRRPLLQRRDQGVLGELLGESDVVDKPGQPGDDPGRLQLPDGVDRPMYGGHWWAISPAARRPAESR